MCIHIDSRFPFCSDYCKTLIKLHGNFGQVIIPFKTEGTKAAAAANWGLIGRAALPANKEET